MNKVQLGHDGLLPSETRVTDWTGGELRIVARTTRFEERYVKEGRLNLEQLPIEEVDLGRETCLPFGDGFALPQPLDVGDPELPGLLIHIGIRDGRPCCVGLSSTETGPAITTTLLKSGALPPIGGIVREIVTHSAVRVARTAEGQTIGIHTLSTPDLHSTWEERFADVAAALDEAERDSRRWRLTDEHLEEVAAVYRDAHNQGLPTAKTIAARWNTSQQNARRWVQRARDKRLLPKTKQRKARA